MRTIVSDPALAEPTVAFTYTLTGQRAAMTDASGTTTYAYDALDRLIAKATPFGTLRYTYDAASNLLTLQSSNVNGTAVSYAYDDLNRLETVTDQRLNPGATSYTYDAAGNLDTLTYPNGVASAHTYDDLSRLTELEISAGTLLGRYTYTLDDTGARTKLVDETGRTVDYGYDLAYRLLNETITNDPQGSNGRIGSTYDATGNRLHRRIDLDGVSDQTVSYDANDRPTSDTYDDNGNLLTMGGTTYSYDYANRLVSDGSITLTYDGDGNLVAQTVGGVTTTYLVDTQNPTGYAQIVEEQVSGQVQRTFSYGYDLISVNAVHSGSATPHFYGYDGLGTVRFLTDRAGTVTDEYEYEAFGGILHSSGSTANPYRFTGERYDADLELYYLRARWYNQGTGRFLTMDTFPGCNTDPLSLHKYTYAHNDPGNKIDPSGLMAESALQLNAVVLPTKVVVEALGLTVACVLAIQATSFMATLIGEQVIGINWIACAAATKQGKWTCQAQCNVVNFSNVPNAPARVTGSGTGSTESDACQTAKTNAVHEAPTGTYARHCKGSGRKYSSLLCSIVQWAWQHQAGESRPRDGLKFPLPLEVEVCVSRYCISILRAVSIHSFSAQRHTASLRDGGCMLPCLISMKPMI